MVIQVDGREVALTCIHVGVDLLRVNEILNNKVRCMYMYTLKGIDCCLFLDTRHNIDCVSLLAVRTRCRPS